MGCCASARVSAPASDLESGLCSPDRKVGLVYDKAMCAHRDQSSMHPETPERIAAIYSALQKQGLTARCVHVDSRVATSAELALAHDGEYLKHFFAKLDTADKARVQLLLGNSKHNCGSVYANTSTHHCALLAAGSTMQVTERALQGGVESGVAVVRPPGHHAEAQCAMGFCFLNNVALAAHKALQEGVQRIMILDWDVHHGNGIQNMFYSDPRVLYVSLHRYDHGRFYPGTKQAGPDRVGAGKGRGFNVNVGWNQMGMGDAEYLHAFDDVVLPIARQFQPQLLLVSAGFDAADGDPLGGNRITPLGYARLTSRLVVVCDAVRQGEGSGGSTSSSDNLDRGAGSACAGPIIVLEGGYLLSAISASTAACAQVLLEGRVPAHLVKAQVLEDTALLPGALRDIKATKRALRPFWTFDT